MSDFALYLPLHRGARRRFFSKPAGWLIVLSAIWVLALAVFNALPEIDLWVSQAFFRESLCGNLTIQDKLCGSFPYSSHSALVVLRRIFFYLPVAVALYLLAVLVDNFQHHGATYCWRKTRDYSIALTTFLIGPYLLVNLVLKQISARPRPYETDLFGGHKPFAAAGDFEGACVSNCSFISGEAAGAGWLACLILLMPKHLRPVLAPPLLVMSLISPALRISFGGHYLSDVMLGWLSSLLVYAAVATCFEMSQHKRKQVPPTFL